MFIGRELVALVSRTINDLYFVVAVNEVVIPGLAIAKANRCGNWRRAVRRRCASH